jgi:protein ImuB
MTAEPADQTTDTVRMIAVWCPDWPVTSVRLVNGQGERDMDPETPVAVVSANHVVACSHAARRAGVRRGLRRREAQGRCPALVVLPRDEGAEVRAFEPVVQAIESLAPGVEISRPGIACVGSRGPTRYFGGETAVVHALSRALITRLGDLAAVGSDVLIGIADGPFAAEQAARRGMIVDPGGAAAFLADMSVDTLGLPELADLLKRLGIRTLAAFAALPATDVLARFGPAGAWAHRQAGGRDARPIAARQPAAEFSAEVTFEPAVDTAEAVTFSTRTTAEHFVSDLAGHGLACTCLELLVRTEHGEETVRRWRHAGVLGTLDVLDRVRWQLDSWLAGRHPEADRPTAGVTLLRLIPVECVPMLAHQQALWGTSGADDERAHRALARLATLLGHGSVLTAVADGGRTPAERTRLIPWGDERTPLNGPDRPWPGRLPAPAPSVLLDPPRPVQVLDASGRQVTVTERGAVSEAPAQLSYGNQPVPITAWAGPWPVDDRWWEGHRPRRRARFQLVDPRGRAYLATCTLPGSPVGTHPLPQASTDAAVWTLDAVYD